MHLEIITPEKTLYSAQNVTLIQLPGISGSFEVMDHHAPLITILKKGNVKVVTRDEKPQFFEINGGVIEVLKDKILILAE